MTPSALSSSPPLLLSSFPPPPPPVYLLRLSEGPTAAVVKGWGTHTPRTVCVQSTLSLIYAAVIVCNYLQMRFKLFIQLKKDTIWIKNNVNGFSVLTDLTETKFSRVFI